MKGDWDLPCDPLAALRDGDPAPFEEFVRRTARSLVGFFRRQGASLHQAEDLTQEVYLKLHANAPRYRAESRFQGFCMQVARNLWIDERRRGGVRSLERNAEEPGDLDRAPSGRPAPFAEPGAAAVLDEETRRLRNALAELPETHRLVFELGVVQELPYGEIAEALEIPVGTVKSRMFHAVRKLRAALETEGDEA